MKIELETEQFSCLQFELGVKKRSWPQIKLEIELKSYLQIELGLNERLS